MYTFKNKNKFLIKYLYIFDLLKFNKRTKITYHDSQQFYNLKFKKNYIFTILQ